MATVAAMAAAQARQLLEERPPTNELTCRRRLRDLTECVHAALTTYILLRYSEPHASDTWSSNWEERERRVTTLLEWTNSHDDQQDETIQRFINQYIPHWPLLAKRCVERDFPTWRRLLLDEEAEEVDEDEA